MTHLPQMNKSRLQQVLSGAANKSIAVIGDVMLDRFIYGKVSRISPEAPVPVVEVMREESYPGGAANVARNLAPFCKSVWICGLTGQDKGADELASLLLEEGVRTDTLLALANHSTTIKTRIIARHQQVVRVDRERRHPCDPLTAARLLEKLTDILDACDALILEDYGKGLLTSELLEGILRLVQGTGKIVTVDPNPANPLNWHGVHTVKPNRLEAFAAAGLPHTEPAANPLQDPPLLEAGRILMEKWNPQCLLITLGEHGMMLFEKGCPPFHTPTIAREVFDVSGAGDTAIALYTASLVAGATPSEAAEISNIASGVVVGKLGTATLEKSELLAGLSE